MRVEGLHRECRNRLDVWNVMTPEDRAEDPPHPPCDACAARWAAAMAADQGEFLRAVEVARRG